MPISIALHLLLAASALPAEARTYLFDPANTQISGTRVDRDHTYQAGGFGYEPGSTEKALLFSVSLPEGNYRVTVRFGDRRQATLTTVKAESRRLMLRDVATRRGQFVERSFVVNVRDAQLISPPKNAPGGSAVRIDAMDARSFTWDDKLTLEFLGKPGIASIKIEAADVPTMYLVGDSTVTDQYAEPAASWGQMLPAMLDDRVAVANHAKSGETLKSFLTGLRFEKALSTMKRGDWLLIQFGHNDQKKEWPQTYVDAATTYPAYLRAYIEEARRRGATPILVTSPERRNFDQAGHITGTLTDYAEAVRRVSREDHVPLIDLNAASKDIYEALGPDKAPLAFNDDGKDKTHHNNYGAWLLASAVAQGIRSAVPDLAPHVAIPSFDPSHPPASGDIRIEPSIAHSSTRPAGN